MASNASTTAGTVFAVSVGVPATYDATGFAAKTYTAVGDVSEMGEYGAEYALVTFTPLATRVVQKYKGSVNYGALAIQMALYRSDAGQTILDAASVSDSSYSFKITHQDGSDDYFTGKVMSFKTNVGAADNIKMASVAIEVDSAQVPVA